MIDVTVSTQIKKGIYYAVLYYNDPIKGYQYKWKSTKIKVIDEKQKRLHKQAKQEASNKAEELRKAFEEELNNKIVEKKKSIVDDRAKQKFSDYMRNWAQGTKGKKEEGTSSTYITNVNGIIAPFFDDTDITLEELQPIHLQDFYDYQYTRILTRGKNKGKLVSKNTVSHYHKAIHKGLADAVQLGIIPYNPDDRTNVEKPNPYIASYYNEDECVELLEKVKNTPLELIVNIATYFALKKIDMIESLKSVE